MFIYIHDSLHGILCIRVKYLLTPFRNEVELYDSFDKHSYECLDMRYHFIVKTGVAPFNNEGELYVSFD